MTTFKNEPRSRPKSPANVTKYASHGEAITVVTNDEAAELNERMRTGRVERGEVDDEVTATGSDGLPIGAGDLIQTRRNDTALGVANRQQWIVQHIADDGADQIGVRPDLLVADRRLQQVGMAVVTTRRTSDSNCSR